jgi:hypothetical protein
MSRKQQQRGGVLYAVRGAATIEEMVGQCFLCELPRLHKESIVRCELVENSVFGSQLVQLGSSSETGDSQQGREAVNTKVEGSTALEAVTGLVKTQQTEKT